MAPIVEPTSAFAQVRECFRLSGLPSSADKLFFDWKLDSVRKTGIRRESFNSWEDAMLIIILIVLLLLAGGGGYYMGPGVGYYGGGGLSLVLLIVIIYLLVGRGRGRV